MTGIPAKLFMGRIVDADQVYVNGTEVGNITYQYPPRRYNLAPGCAESREKHHRHTGNKYTMAKGVLCLINPIS